MTADAVLDSVLADACTAGRRAEVLVGQAIAVVVLAVTGLGDCTFHWAAVLGVTADAVLDSVLADARPQFVEPRSSSDKPSQSLSWPSSTGLGDRAFHGVTGLGVTADAVLDGVLGDCPGRRRLSRGPRRSSPRSRCPAVTYLWRRTFHGLAGLAAAACAAASRSAAVI